MKAQENTAPTFSCENNKTTAPISVSRGCFQMESKYFVIGEPITEKGYNRTAFTRDKNQCRSFLLSKEEEGSPF